MLSTARPRKYVRPKNRYKRSVWMELIKPLALRGARGKAGYSQADLAGLVGCTQAFISALEKGVRTQCSEVLATKIATRLDRDVEELFNRHEQNSSIKNTIHTSVYQLSHT